MAEMRVIVEGGYNATTGVYGSTTPILVTPSNTPATAENVKITDGTNVVTVSASATVGNALAVSTGSVFPGTTLNAVTANTTGTAVDAGSARSNWTAIAVATGAPTGGTLTLELSFDGTTWAPSGTTQTVTAAGTFFMASTGRPARYARVSLSGLAGTITLTTTMMAAG